MDVKAYRVTEMMGTMVENFMNDTVELSTLGRMVRQVVEHGPEVRNRVEQRLREERLEEEAATRTILMEGENAWSHQEGDRSHGRYGITTSKMRNWSGA